MPAGHILIVAPETDLRRSLEFALEADGYRVTAWPEICTDPGGAFDCTVIDEGALSGPAAQVAAFCDAARPVVLLSDNPIAWLVDRIDQRLDKPLLGSALSVAVSAAIAFCHAAAQP